MTPRLSHARVLAGFAVLSLIWGSNWIAGSFSLPPLRVGAIRCTAGAVVIALLALIHGLLRPSVGAALPSSGRANALAGTTLGLTLIAIPYLLVTWAGQHGPAVLEPLVFATLPIAAIFAGLRLSGPSGSRSALQYALIGFGGVALLLSNGLSFRPAYLLPAGLLLAAVVSHAAALVWAKTVLLQSSLPASLAWQLATAAVVLWAVSLALEQTPTISGPATGLVTLITLGAVGSGIGYLLYLWLLRKTEPFQTATVQWLLPVVSMAETALLVRQLPPWSIFAGAAVSLVCAFLLLRLEPDDLRPVTLQVTESGSGQHSQNLR